ncbi:hypothetical protein ACIBF1_06980 [Spirillospora sp. NPDC050679]
MEVTTGRRGAAGGRTQITVTVSFDAAEDPDEHVEAFLTDRLEGVLGLYAHIPTYALDPLGQSDPEAWARALGAVGDVVGKQLPGELERLMWAARFTGGPAWGRIAVMTGHSRGAVRTIVERVAGRQADRGVWRAEFGLHQGDPRQARVRAGSRAGELAGRRVSADRLDDTVLD